MFRECALLLACACACGVRVSVSADSPGDFGVKLCGREFIRAVIFTCGGSRWRREHTPPGGAWLSEQVQERMREDEGVPSSLWAVLRLADARTGERDTWAGPRFSSAPEGGASDRRKRNFSLGLAGMCCNQGCTKNDIGRLC